MVPEEDLVYYGTWNAMKNIPCLKNCIGIYGRYYIVSYEGDFVLNGYTKWKSGDWVIFNGENWEKKNNENSQEEIEYVGGVTEDGCIKMVGDLDISKLI